MLTPDLHRMIITGKSQQPKIDPASERTQDDHHALVTAANLYRMLFQFLTTEALSPLNIEQRAHHHLVLC